MIVIRFGLWSRQLHGSWEDRRMYLFGVPVPLCRRRPRDMTEWTQNMPLSQTVLHGMQGWERWRKAHEERRKLWDKMSQEQDSV